ncbi:MAG: hypothetical protein WBG86_23035, partial [Polyangiales bacterium]
MSIWSYVVAIVGGMFLASAFVVGGAWPAALLGVAAFVLAAEWSRETRVAVHAALLFGVCGYVGGYHWLQPALVAFSGGYQLLSWAVWLALGAWVALRFLLIMIGYRALRRRRCNTILALMLPWLSIEWLY